MIRMQEKDTFDVVQRAVFAAVAKIQCRPVEYYQDKTGLVISSCDIAAMLPTLEQILGCDPFTPNDFAQQGGVAHGGVCYDPIEDIPIGEICERVATRTMTVESGVL